MSTHWQHPLLPMEVRKGSAQQLQLEEGAREVETGQGYQGIVIEPAFLVHPT